MINHFKNYLLSKASLTNAELNAISQKLEVIRLKKGENLYTEGTHWPFDGIVCYGLLYKHTTNLQGDLSIKGFSSENYWVGDRGCALTGAPLPYTATALEDTGIAYMTCEAMDYLRIHIPTFNDICEDLVQRNISALQNRVVSHSVMSDEERYANFIATRHGLISRIDPALVACYLDILPKNMDTILNGIPLKTQQ